MQSDPKYNGPFLIDKKSREEGPYSWGWEEYQEQVSQSLARICFDQTYKLEKRLDRQDEWTSWVEFLAYYCSRHPDQKQEGHVPDAEDIPEGTPLPCGCPVKDHSGPLQRFVVYQDSFILEPIHETPALTVGLLRRTYARGAEAKRRGENFKMCTYWLRANKCTALCAWIEGQLPHFRTTNSGLSDTSRSPEAQSAQAMQSSSLVEIDATRTKSVTPEPESEHTVTWQDNVVEPRLDNSIEGRQSPDVSVMNHPNPHEPTGTAKRMRVSFKDVEESATEPSTKRIRTSPATSDDNGGEVEQNNMPLERSVETTAHIDDQMLPVSVKKTKAVSKGGEIPTRTMYPRAAKRKRGLDDAERVEATSAQPRSKRSKRANATESDPSKSPAVKRTVNQPGRTAPAKQLTTKKAPAKTAAARKNAAKVAEVKQATAKKDTAKKATQKKATTDQTASRNSRAKRITAKDTPKTTATAKRATTKNAAEKNAAKKNTATKKTTTKSAPKTNAAKPAAKPTAKSEAVKASRKKQSKEEPTGTGSGEAVAQTDSSLRRSTRVTRSTYKK